jgi:hypothetical protein
MRLSSTTTVECQRVGIRVEIDCVAIGWPTVSSSTEATIRAHLAAGAGILKVAKEVGVGTSSVQRITSAMAA